MTVDLAGTPRLVVESPVGPLVLESDGEQVTHLHLPNTGAAANGSSAGKVAPPLREAARQLDQYFAGKRTEFTLPLAPAGTEFQRSVWLSLPEIPYGEVVSYAELAGWVGRPTAYRAVGQANGANPVAIILPCHRVVASGGGIGGYGGGLDVKRQLLALEGWEAEH
jgi:methylated-DNA-[protein]-cysteine S-methyltransferase